MIRSPELLLASIAALFAGCAVTPATPANPTTATAAPAAAIANLAGTYLQGDGRTLHLLPGGRFFYAWNSEVDVFPPTYDTGSWQVRGGEVVLTRAKRVTGVAQAPVRYTIGVDPAANPPAAQLTSGTMIFALSERIDTARASALTASFEDTNRVADVYNDLVTRFAVRSEDAEIEDGSWTFSGKCSLLIDEIQFNADKIETSRTGSVLKLSGNVHVQSGTTTRDVPTTTLRFAGGELISVEPRIDLSP